MRQFTFRLEAIRSLRQQQERWAKEQLARRLDAKAARQAAHDRTRRDLASARASAARSLAGPVAAAELRAQQAYLERCEREERDARAIVAEHDLEVQACRAELVERARAREALDRLRQRKLREHEEVLARVEQVALSEVALTMHRRREASG